MVESLRRVNFTVRSGDQVWFDQTGAATARYEVVNWQQALDGGIIFRPVGYYDASLPAGQNFVLRTEDIMWPGGEKQVRFTFIIKSSNFFVCFSYLFS